MAVKLGNGNWAVKENKLLAYNDNSGRFFNKEFDFARGSSATYVGKDGLIKSAASDVPRIDFSDSTNGALLLEPQRTNSLLQSNQFDTTWSKTLATITSDEIASPISGEMADSILATATSGGHRVLQAPSTTGVGTFTMYIKQKELSRICVHFLGANKAAGFDCSDNTTFAATGIASYPTRYNISNFGNGWSKVEMYDVGTTTRVDIYIANPTSGGNNAVWTGDGTSKIYFSAAQFEIGSYATSYIPTSGSTVTRLADVCNNSGSAQDFNSEEGVLYAEISALADADNYRIISLNAGNSLASIFIGLRNNTGNVYMYMPTDDTSYISNVNATNNFTKIALKYKTNDVSFFINGTKVFTDNTVTLPTGLNQLDFSYGNSSNSYPFRGKVKCLAVFTTALTDEQLAALTTI